MQINLTGKNLPITPALRTHVEDKFKSLDKRFSNITNIHVVLHIEHLDHCAEASIHFDGIEFHATASATDMYVSIDQLEEKLETQMHKHKEKIIDSHR